MNAIEILERLENDVQDMRESGETDLRSVIHLIRNAKKEVEPDAIKLKEELKSIGKVVGIGLAKSDPYHMEIALKAIQMAVKAYE